MEYGLIGEKLGHSFSAEIHPKITGKAYELKELSKDSVEAFIKQKDFKGINVTIPYKQTVMPFLDNIDENAKEIGAVNTIVNKNGVLYGHNTDFGGLLALIKKKKNDLTDKKALILGDGGASKAAFAVLKHLNAKEILIVSLFPGNGKISYNDALTQHFDAEIIINATPVGMFPNVNGMAIDISRFKNLELVVDVVYNPLRTDLTLAAEKMDVPALTGLYMLVGQAVLAAGHFTENEFGTEITDKIFNEIVTEKRNIVLTGMPCSGKTTIGKVLAEKLGREFVDTDELIVKKAGKQITEIFANEGEAEFRRIESEVIADISLQNGLIIATGGGAVLNNDNIRHLKHNGIVFFLDRELNELIPTDDRPLANSKESIIKRYNERIDIYNSTNDYSVKVIGPEKTANEIIKIFKGIDI